MQRREVQFNASSSFHIKAAILDRNQHCIDKVSDKLKLYYPEISITTSSTSLEETIEKVQKEAIDLLILDDHYCTHPSFNLIDQYRFQNQYFQVVLTAETNMNMSTAVNIGATGFLYKPIDPKVFILCMERVKQMACKKVDAHHSSDELNHHFSKERNTKIITIPDSSGFKLVNADNIVYLKADGAYVHIVLEKERYLVSKRLKDYDFLFDEAFFFRTHRSYLVNINQIANYVNDSGGYIIMKNGDHISLARDKRKDFFKLFDYR